MAGKMFHVWESEYPEEGSVLIEAISAKHAQQQYTDDTGGGEVELDVVECDDKCPCRATRSGNGEGTL